MRLSGICITNQNSWLACKMKRALKRPNRQTTTKVWIKTISQRNMQTCCLWNMLITLIRTPSTEVLMIKHRAVYFTQMTTPDFNFLTNGIISSVNPLTACKAYHSSNWTSPLSGIVREIQISPSLSKAIRSKSTSLMWSRISPNCSKKTIEGCSK